MRLTVPLIALMSLPVTAASHPHVFVEAAVRVVFDDVGGVAVHLDWQYDDFFSLLVTSDLGLDMDGDLVLTAEEQALLETEIAAWPPDYAGDLEVMQGGAVLPLGEKFDHSMVYEEGIFTERHARPVANAALDQPLQIRVYDPAFYTAYDLTGPVTVEGRDDCAVEIIRADLDAAYALAESLLGGPIDEQGPDDYFPAIGDAFADTIQITCAGL
jgi:polyphosphate kinase